MCSFLHCLTFCRSSRTCILSLHPVFLLKTTVRKCFGAFHSCPDLHPAFVTDTLSCHGYSSLSRMHGCSCLSRILLPVTDALVCHGCSYLSRMLFCSPYLLSWHLRDLFGGFITQKRTFGLKRHFLFSRACSSSLISAAAAREPCGVNREVPFLLLSGTCYQSHTAIWCLLPISHSHLCAAAASRPCNENRGGASQPK